MTRNALAALCAAALATTAAADTIKVPQGQPTIADAVAAANDGDTIIIKKGRYEESVMITGLTGITIRGKGKVVIAPPSGPGLHVIDCNDVTVQGIGVENASDGFLFDGCSGVDLTKFTVRGADRHGVFAFGSSDMNVSRGKVSACGFDGISYADEVPDFPVMGGTVSRVRVTDCREDGIDILGSNVLVVGCRVVDCGDDCFESDDLGAGPVTFENCNATDCNDEGFEMGCPATVAIRCTAKDTGDDGYDIEGDDCVLDKCTAKGAREAGFSIDGVNGTELKGCKALKCQKQGFDFFEATNASAEKCKSVNARGDGYRLTSGTQNCVLTKCKGKKSASFDLRDESDGSNTFPDSKFKTVSSNDG